ncbi:MAG: hypothetical protein WCF18_25650 [Chthoniobacteraceae bacterium]
MAVASVVALLILASFAFAAPTDYFGIHVVDETTGRGVPLVQLRTVNDIALWTDSAGWIAFEEPGLMDREVFFAIESPGYEKDKDGFGNRGVRLQAKAGAFAEVKLKRTVIAERLYRLTGQGIYRDSTLLGKTVPIKKPNLTAGVLGQDSVQAVPYRGRLFWLWGDTNLPHYPLGNFHTTCATSALEVKPDAGIDFDYFTDPEHPDRVRGMVRETEPGPVWIFGLLTVPDEVGKETLIGHFTRHRSLAEVVEQGLVRFDDAPGLFGKIVKIELSEKWRFPQGNAVRVHENDGDYWYFAAPLCHTRVKAVWSAILDPASYEAFSWDGEKYAWSRERAPTTQSSEEELIRTGKLPPEAAHYRVVDGSSGETVAIQGGSIEWNQFRKKWVLIGSQAGGKSAPSYLGEVWYAEADSVTGPWRKAVKIASHPHYTFYNPRHHLFFDEEGGRRIYFEGTYTQTFSGNPVATPRYEYNQLMYRLDLTDPRLDAAR